MAYDPIFTLLPYPGDVMDRSMGKMQVRVGWRRNLAQGDILCACVAWQERHPNRQGSTLTTSLKPPPPPPLQIPASSISFANTFGVLFTIVFYDLVLVPVTKK
jgi:hypothetical protein